MEVLRERSQWCWEDTTIINPNRDSFVDYSISMLKVPIFPIVYYAL